MVSVLYGFSLRLCVSASRNQREVSRSAATARRRAYPPRACRRCASAARTVPAGPSVTSPTRIARALTANRARMSTTRSASRARHPRGEAPFVGHVERVEPQDLARRRPPALRPGWPLRRSASPRRAPPRSRSAPKRNRPRVRSRRQCTSTPASSSARTGSHKRRRIAHDRRFELQPFPHREDRHAVRADVAADHDRIPRLHAPRPKRPRPPPPRRCPPC